MLRATLEATWDGILVTDEHGQVTDFNRAVRRDVAHPPADVMDSTDHRRDLTNTSASSSMIAGSSLPGSRTSTPSPDESLDILELADGRVFERYSTLQIIDGRNVGPGLELPRHHGEPARGGGAAG